jgi:hypothetical protein
MNATVYYRDGFNYTLQVKVASNQTVSGKEYLYSFDSWRGFAAC